MIKTYINDNKYTIESEKIKVEFSNPSIQAHDEYGYLMGEKSILYYYYTVETYIKKGKHWKKMFSTNAYDFPGILDFKEILKSFIEGIPSSRYQKDVLEKSSGYTCRNYTLKVGGLVEDYYLLNHQIIMENSKEISNEYTLTIGNALDYRAYEVESVTFNCLSLKDLEKIYEIVSDFVKFSIDSENKKNKAYNNKCINSWRYVDGKIYQMNEDESIESIFVVGDLVDSAIILEGDLENNNYYSRTISKFIIEEINKNSIVLKKVCQYSDNDGANDVSEIEVVNFSTLLYLFTSISDKKLNYNENDIEKDFTSLLSEFEKIEFKQKSIDYLFNKYKNAIIDRTWMCREEHNLPIRVKDAGNHENVYASVRVIIENIKNSLL